MKDTNFVNSPFFNDLEAIKIEELNTKIIMQQYENIGVDICRYIDATTTVSIYECPRTQFRFYSPTSIFGDDIFYETLQKKVLNYYPSDKQEFFIALQKIQQGDKVLEIGCGDGKFLDLLKGKNAVSKGLEFNSLAIEKCLKKGHIVESMTIEEFAGENENSFDFVVSFQVLEHIIDLSAFIKAIISVVKPGGRILFAVPNSDPYYQHFRIYETMNLPPHHSGFWNAKVFLKLSKFFPLELESIDYTGDLNLLASVYYCSELFIRKNLNINTNKKLLVLLSVIASPFISIKVFKMFLLNQLKQHCIIATYIKTNEE